MSEESKEVRPALAARRAELRDWLAHELFKADLSVRDAFMRRCALETMGAMTLAQWVDSAPPRTLDVYRALANRVLELLELGADAWHGPVLRADVLRLVEAARCAP